MIIQTRAYARAGIAYLWAEISADGSGAGIATPMNDVIVQVTKRVERGDLKPAPENLKLLEACL